MCNSPVFNSFITSIFYKVNKMCQIETIFDIVSKNLLTLFDNPAHLISLFFYISRFGSFWYSRGQRQQDYAAQRGPQRRRKQTHAIRRASASSGCSFGGDFAVSAKPHCVRRREGPCFGVWAAVCDFSPKAECVPIFTHESECGLFVREVEKCDEKWFETAL